MPRKEEFIGLFDIASQMKKNKTTAKAPGLEKEKKAPLSQEEMQALFQRCKKMHDEIQEKIEAACEKAHLSPKQIHEYINNPENFQSDEWAALIKKKRELEAKLRAFQGEVPEAVPKEKQKRAKGGYADKTKWISM